MTNSELADWLAELDSHGIYGEELLEELPEDLREVVPTQTPRQVALAIQRRGLGGSLDSSYTGRLFTGYSASLRLAQFRLRRDPAPGVAGRGTIHRMSITALRRGEE